MGKSEKNPSKIAEMPTAQANRAVNTEVRNVRRRRVFETKKLSTSVVEGLLPIRGRNLAWDKRIPGFGVYLTKTGRRVYFLKYRTTSGVIRKPKIGDHGAITCEQARDIAEKWYLEARIGNDPSGERRATRTGETIADLCERYHAEYSTLRKKRSTVNEERGMIDRHVKPNWGRTRIVDLTRQDVIRVHTKMARIPVTANRLVALMSHMMSMAMKWNLRPDGQNPCKGVEKFKEKRREVYLEKPAIDELFRTLDDSKEFNTPTSAFFKLSVLIGTRPSELLLLRWSEVDFARKRLVLPDSKTGAKPVYLSDEAISILGALPRVAGSPWVFPGRDPSKPRKSMRHAWDRIRTKLKYDDVRAYDMRHTFATTGLTNGVQLHELKGLLGHKVLATTLRYAHVLDKDMADAARKIGKAVMA